MMKDEIHSIVTEVRSQMPAKRPFQKQRLKGIVVALVTPFKRTHEQDLDLVTLGNHVEFLVHNGVHGLMPLGTTGEFGFLDRDERRQVIETVVESTSRRVPVIAGVSDSGTGNAIALAKDAEDAGADLIIATGPYYYKTNSEGLYVHYQTILDAVDSPLMIYNIPEWTGYNIPPTVVKRLVMKNPGRVAGVKFTTDDMKLFLEYVRMLKHDLRIFIGSDDLIFAALGLGAAGAVAGCANVFPKETTMIYNYFEKGNLSRSRKLQNDIDPFARTMSLGTYPAAVKEALALIGHDCGPVRRPLVALSASERAKLKASLGWMINRR
jgi:4-hydroxy-tetrahydrodipicolinate synthase